MGRELVIYEQTFSIPDLAAAGEAIEKDPCGLSVPFFPFGNSILPLKLSPKICGCCKYFLNYLVCKFKIAKVEGISGP